MKGIIGEDGEVILEEQKVEVAIADHYRGLFDEDMEEAAQVQQEPLCELFRREDAELAME